MLSLSKNAARLGELVPGLGVACLLAIAALFVEKQIGGSRMLYAFMFGMLISPLVSVPRFKPGTVMASGFVLRTGVMLLGAGVTFTEIQAVGLPAAILAVLVVSGTILIGYRIALAFGLDRHFATISSGAIAICGASAALAVASVLPASAKKDQHTGLTIAGVTILSTIAMMVYPAISRFVGLSDMQAGVFFGTAIHDVAQVVAAGHIISDATAETAAIVKLMRVACLVPAVIIISLIYKRSRQEIEKIKTPILPWFLIGFVILCGIGNLGVFSDPVAGVIRQVSGIFLVIAVAAIGMKSSIKGLLVDGFKPIYAMVLTTLVLCAGTLTFVMLAVPA